MSLMKLQNRKKLLLGRMKKVRGGSFGLRSLNRLLRLRNLENLL
uniref:Uncharacterized protein n=1 Tax=Arundo donax TaxID=35708 RepID=A0A0A9EWA6_ARUDO